MPPAFATVIDNEGGHAPAIGASKIGIFKPNRSQNSLDAPIFILSVDVCFPTDRAFS
jgi:hypothetical protein